MTDGTGAASATYTYDEYGVPGAGNGGARMSYTGQMWLASLGLYHYKARSYNPATGRFMQPDPILYGDGMNIYNYAGGDPVNFVDPFGLCSALPVYGGDNASVTFTYTGCGGGGGGGLTVASPAGTRSEKEADGTRERRKRKKKDKEKKCNQLLINIGNFLAEGSNQTANLSAAAFTGGVVVAGVGVVTIQPEIVGAGGALIATGGVLGVTSGVSQIAGGLFQAAGGGSYGLRNAANGLISIGVGLGIARGFRVPQGYRTVSQRKIDNFVRNTSPIIGGTVDLANFLGSLGAEQDSCIN